MVEIWVGKWTYILVTNSSKLNQVILGDSPMYPGCFMLLSLLLYIFVKTGEFDILARLWKHRIWGYMTIVLHLSISRCCVIIWLNTIVCNTMPTRQITDIRVEWLPAVERWNSLATVVFARTKDGPRLLRLLKKLWH